MIIGVTLTKTAVSSNGCPFHQGLHRLPPNGDRNHPPSSTIRLPAQEEVRNRVGGKPTGTDRALRDECRELHIMLIDDDIENVSPRPMLGGRPPNGSAG